MRKLLSTTAGASFHYETPNLTLCVRKESLEFIFKLKPGLYMIIHMLHQAKGEAMLFVNWGRYFDRLQNPAVQMPRIAKNCPKLYAVMTGEDKDGVFEFETAHNDSPSYHGFGMTIPVDEDLPMYACITKEVIDKVMLMVNKNIDMYNELNSNPPFPAWKDGLKEVWN